MGGDFMMDKEGVVRYIYCSQKSTDRPSVQEILDNLKVSFFVSSRIIVWSFFFIKKKIFIRWCLDIIRHEVSFIGIKVCFSGNSVAYHCFYRNFSEGSLFVSSDDKPNRKHGKVRFRGCCWEDGFFYWCNIGNQQWLTWTCR